MFYYRRSRFCVGALFLLATLIFSSDQALPATRKKPTPTPFPSNRIVLWATSPWLSLMVRFVGGVNLYVSPLGQWNEAGDLVIDKPPADGSRVVALDPVEGNVYGVSDQKGLEVKNLFASKLAPLHNQGGRLLDPATMPFVGLRILTVLAALDPGNYLYYQRRLAEFQSRLESTVGVGRRLLAGMSFVDLTRQYAFWIDATGARVVRPPLDVLKAWGKKEQLEALEKTLEEATAGNWIVLYDPETPPVVKERLALYPKALLLPFPDLNVVEDLFLFLYDQYLLVWKFPSRPAPTVPAPRNRREG